MRGSRLPLGLVRAERAGWRGQAVCNCGCSEQAGGQLGVPRCRRCCESVVCRLEAGPQGGLDGLCPRLLEAEGGAWLQGRRRGPESLQRLSIKSPQTARGCCPERRLGWQNLSGAEQAVRPPMLPTEMLLRTCGLPPFPGSWCLLSGSVRGSSQGHGVEALTWVGPPLLRALFFLMAGIFS
jgi:hypothetical protein